MKKNKIIGIGIASLGVVISMGSAVALYTRAASSTGFNIGAGTYSGSTGVVTYKVNDNTSGSVAPQYWNSDGSDKTGTGLGGIYNQIVYEFTLSATYANDINAQSVTLGNVAVSVTNIPETYRGKLNIWVDIVGYTASTIGESTYKNVFMTEQEGDYAITAEHQSYSANKDIAVKSAGGVSGQKVRVFLKFAESAYSDLYGADEASLGYSLSLTWGRVSNEFAGAFVVGNGNQWSEDDEFAMVPDIDNATWRWRYDNLPGASLGQAKCKKGSTWSTGSNTVLTSGKHYNVFWNGNGSSSPTDDATFTQLD